MAPQGKNTQLADRPLNVPSPLRLDPANKNYAVILAAHQDALDRNADGYIDPITSLFVITSTVHKARGYCCDNNCRHCPYA
jgi:hypothetical protein